MSCQNCCNCRKSPARPPEVEAPPLVIEASEPPSVEVPISTYLMAVAIIAAAVLHYIG